MRQLIVDLKTEYADLTNGQIAAIGVIQFTGRRPSHRTVESEKDVTNNEVPFLNQKEEIWKLRTHQ